MTHAPCFCLLTHFFMSHKQPLIPANLALHMPSFHDATSAIPYTCHPPLSPACSTFSTVATASFEDIAAVGHAERVFQLYVIK